MSVYVLSMIYIPEHGAYFAQVHTIPIDTYDYITNTHLLNQDSETQIDEDGQPMVLL